MIPRRNTVASLEALVKTKGLTLLNQSPAELAMMHRRLQHVAGQSAICKAAARELAEMLDLPQ